MSGTVAAIAEQAASHAYVSVEAAFGKAAWPPAGVAASDRVRRMADEAAGRMLRSAAHQVAIVAGLLGVVVTRALLEAMPPAARDANWAAIVAATPSATPTERRNLLRAVRRVEVETGALPASPYDVVTMPVQVASSITPLDAADRQAVRLGSPAATSSLAGLLAEGDAPLVSLAESDGTVMLALQLPLVAGPAARAQWAWHTLALAVPQWARSRYATGVACRPSLRITPGHAYFLLPLEVPVPPPDAGPSRLDPARVLGLDWGVRRLLTGSVGSPDPACPLDPARVAVTGRPLFFKAAGMQARLGRIGAPPRISPTGCVGSTPSTLACSRSRSATGSPRRAWRSSPRGGTPSAR